MSGGYFDYIDSTSLSQIKENMEKDLKNLTKKQIDRYSQQKI